MAESWDKPLLDQSLRALDGAADVIDKAADEIASLRARLTTAETRLDEVRAALNDEMVSRAAAEARVEALTEALRKIAEFRVVTDTWPGAGIDGTDLQVRSPQQEESGMRRIARAVLACPPERGE